MDLYMVAPANFCAPSGLSLSTTAAEPNAFRLLGRCGSARAGILGKLKHLLRPQLVVTLRGILELPGNETTIWDDAILATRTVSDRFKSSRKLVCEIDVCDFSSIGQAARKPPLSGFHVPAVHARFRPAYCMNPATHRRTSTLRKPPSSFRFLGKWNGC